MVFLDSPVRLATVARLGGDEFVILLTGLTDVRTAANVVAQQCLTAVSEPFEFAGRKLALGMSIGIAAHAGRAVTASYLITQADIATYQTKHKGKGNIFFMEEVGVVDCGYQATSICDAACAIKSGMTWSPPRIPACYR